MTPEQSQIMGFFIEESRDHLGTIERGLLDLGGTLDDSEMLDEVFRAAHSIKGGAAMLGLGAIQTVSHRLEDCFKILKENPISTDQQLESLFLQIFDSLQELFDRLQSPEGLSEGESQRITTEIDPLCQNLGNYIEGLARGEAPSAPAGVPESDRSALPATSPISTQSEEDSALQLIMTSDVLARLREMLQLFKQPDNAETRQSLQRLCRLLARVGDQFDLDAWVDLVKTVEAAIARRENTLITLASVAIKEIKQAQELVLANREAEIVASPRLQALVPDTERPEADPESVIPVAQTTPPPEAPAPISSKPPRSSKGPQVGMAELSSLADLFEGDNDELDDWNEAEHFDPSGMSETSDRNFDDEVDSDFSDLFVDDNASSTSESTATDPDFDDDLFGDIDPTADADEDDTGLDDLLNAVERGDHPAHEDNDSDAELEDDLQDLLDIGTEDQTATSEAETENNAADADEVLDFLDFDAEENSEDDTGAHPEKTLTLGDESAAELEALFGQSTANANSQASSSGDGELGDLFGEGDLEDLETSSLGDDFDLDFDLEEEPSTTEASDSDDFDLDFDLEEETPTTEASDSDDFDLDFDLEEETPTTEASDSDDFDLDFDLEEEPSTTEASDSDDFDLDFDLEEEPSTTEASNADDFDLDFDLEEETPETEASNADDFDLDFDLEEETPETEASNADDFDLDFDLEEEPSTTEASNADDFDLDFDLEEEPSTTEASNADDFDLDFDLEEETPETEALDSNDFDLDFDLEDDNETFEPTELSLDDLLGEELGETPSHAIALPSEDNFDLDELFDEVDESSLAEPNPEPEISIEFVQDFPELEVLLNIDPQFLSEDGFDALEAYLDGDRALASSPTPPAESPDDDFKDLESLLEIEPTPSKPVTAPARTSPQTSGARSKRSSTRPAFEQTMRVPIKQLDNLSNLVGELVVNRNSLEQDQERLRQFLDNLLHQVSQLTEVGQRMQDLYERTLLEMALLASRHSRQLAAQGHAPSHQEDGEYDALEMDRFTEFHEQARDIIELVVRVRESSSDIEFLVDENDQVTRQLRQVTTQLQEGLTRSRMVPFANAADRLPRGVRDNAIKFGKQVDLQVEGRDTLIDRMILEHLTDPLTHLVNNAIAHGIESPEERTAKGKPPTGKITISTFHQGNQTIISITDDGAGIDTEKVKAKSIQKGLITPAQAKAMDRIEVYDLLFLPGLSTREQADDLAGRGVGMDVVKTKLNEIRGAINTDSTLGKGTTFTIRLPLTLSISKALCCISDHAPIAFPMDGVGEVLDNLPVDRIITQPDGRSFVQWRDREVPYQPLRDLFTYNRMSRRSQMYGASSDDDTISVVVLRSAGSYLAVSVDSIVGEQEIVIKQLEGPIPKPSGITGATVMGDGRIVPIADVLELIDLSMGRVRHEAGSLLWDDRTTVEAPAPQAEKSEPLVLIVDDSITVRELLSMTFKKSGYRVEQARDGQEAWEKLRSGLPCELVFCDMEMPRMNGMELLEKMHNDEYLCDLPIAMLTSRTAEKMKKKAAEFGARGYFTKPYLEEVLLDAAQRMLNGEVLMATSEEATQEA